MKNLWCKLALAAEQMDRQTIQMVIILIIIILLVLGAGAPGDGGGFPG